MRKSVYLFLTLFSPTKGKLSKTKFVRYEIYITN